MVNLNRQKNNLNRHMDKLNRHTDKPDLTSNALLTCTTPSAQPVPNTELACVVLLFFRPYLCLQLTVTSLYGTSPSALTAFLWDTHTHTYQTRGTDQPM